MFYGSANNALPDEDCQERWYLRCGNFFPEPLAVLFRKWRGRSVVFLRYQGKDTGKHDFFIFVHVFPFSPWGRLHTRSQCISWQESEKPEAFVCSVWCAWHFHLQDVDGLCTADPVYWTVLIFDAEVTRPRPEESTRVRLGSAPSMILDCNRWPYKFFQDECLRC